MRLGLLFAGLLLSGGTARAVVVRGVVRGPLGRPVPGARVQLVALEGAAHSIADTVSGVDGVYEIRSDQAGRFVLLTSSVYFAPQLSAEFYGGRTDLLSRDIVLDPRAIAPQESRAGTALRTPLAQAAAPPAQVSAVGLLPRAQLAGALAPLPGVFLLNQGQTGQGGFLYLQGGSAEDNAVLLDGEELAPLGGPRDRAYSLARVSTSGLASPETTPAVEVLAGPDPAAPLTASAGAVRMRTAEATNTHAALDYAGDAGNLHTWRNELTATATLKRADLLLAGSRFDTSNALPNDRFHLGTLTANGGYQISGNTALRVTARQSAAAGALPIPYDLGLEPTTRDATQETAGTATFSTQTAGGWHNELGYGLLRSREQALVYVNQPGRAVTLTGANGYQASGQAAAFPLPPRQDWATARDSFHYTTEYPLLRHVSGLLQVRYGDERALDAASGQRLTVARESIGGLGALTAELHHRLFVQAGGEVTHSSHFGLVGSPRAGATWAPVVPAGSRRFHGTTLHLVVATGFTEPSLAAEAQGLTTVGRSRTLEASVDQNVYREKLVLHAGYFHGQFSHQVEELAEVSTIPGQPLRGDGLAYRAQGTTVSLLYQPRTRVLVRGSYTYLESLVEMSAEPVSQNPEHPGLPIGVLSALAGARPFYRPPQSGSVVAAYSGRLLSAGVDAAFASRSDGTTGLAQTPVLLLPNRNLNHAFACVDARLAFVLTRRTAVYAEGDNLLNDQHLGTFGYPSAPATVRAGLRFRLGGD